MDKIALIPIKPVAAALATMVVKITDLAINTSSGVYQFGFCCDLSAMDIGIDALKFKGFGLKITFTKAPPPPSPQ